MNEFLTYEFTVKPKTKGKLLKSRIALAALYVIFAVGYFALMVKFLLVPMIALLPVLMWILVFFTWRYVSPEYEYSLTSGSFTFSKIFGNRSRKKVFETQIKDAELIAPNDDANRAKLAKYTINGRYSAVSDEDAEHIYFMLFKENGDYSVIFFEMTEKALKIFRFYNPAGTVMSFFRSSADTND